MRNGGSRVFIRGMAIFDNPVLAPACVAGAEQPTRRSPRCSDERFDRLCRPCPTCGQLGIRIVYGYPSGPLLVAARRGKVIVGGCTHRSVTHRCPQGHEWECPDVQH
jgi:hypothetical protein